MSVSIICACKNRRKPLSISLSSWIQFDEVKEVIITNWNSDDSIDDLSQLSKKIKIINVGNEPYFNQPQPLNLAASLATSDYILKFDCDHVLNPYFNFFDSYQIGDDSFVSGCSDSIDQRSMDAYFLYPLWGLLYVKREIFETVGGYNEQMGKYYAVEDDELAVRLISYGLNPISIDIQKFTALHIAHTDEDRVKNFESFQSIKERLTETRQDLDNEQLYNYMAKLSRNKNHKEYPIVSKMLDLFKNKVKPDIDWYRKRIYNWEIRQLNDQVYEAVKI